MNVNIFTKFIVVLLVPYGRNVNLYNYVVLLCLNKVNLMRCIYIMVAISVIN